MSELDSGTDDAVLRILLIEDNPADAELIRVFLDERMKSRYVIGHAWNLADGLRQLGQGGLDVVLVDLWLPDSDGPDTFLAVAARAERIPIVVISGVDEEQVALTAVRQGAQDYLVKGRVDSELLARSLHFAIERAARHRSQPSEQTVIPRHLADIAVRLSRLSTREREVLDRIVAGKSIKEIAAIHGTSYNTVKNKRARIVDKLQAGSDGDLVRMALHSHFGQEPPS